jgi:hypothetical protein
LSFVSASEAILAECSRADRDMPLPLDGHWGKISVGDN